MLKVSSLHVHYGTAHVLHGVDLEVEAGKIVCLIGRNGAGKSTTLKTIMGLVPATSGEILFEEQRIDAMAAHQVARMGVSYVPEDRRPFGSLSVEENIRVAAQASPRSDANGVSEALAFFPVLEERARQLAGSLSGGEQQMLVIARALVARPRLILLDEPTEGLAPSLVGSIRDGILKTRTQWPLDSPRGAEPLSCAGGGGLFLRAEPRFRRLRGNERRAPCARRRDRRTSGSRPCEGGPEIAQMSRSEHPSCVMPRKTEPPRAALNPEKEISHCLPVCWRKTAPHSRR